MAENNSIIGPRLASLWQGWSAPAYQNFYWGVATFAAGIALYFALPFEPSFMPLLGFCCFLLLGLWLSETFAGRLYPFIIILVLIALGVGRAAWHTQAVSEPILPKYERSYTVTGWIEGCQAKLLDERAFRISGAHDVYIQDGVIELRPANKKGRRERP